MKSLTILIIVASFFYIACNPFGPSELDLVNGVVASPNNITISLGEEQEFIVYSDLGHLDEMGFGTWDITVEDPVCRCEKSIDLGRVSRIKLEENKLIYYAPLTVDGLVDLPVTIDLYVRAGDIGNIKYKNLVEITIIP